VKPFERCLHCGADIPVPTTNNTELNCTSKECTGLEEQAGFTMSDKWAFKSNVWTEL
jgi:hypothetical protein